MKLDDLKTKIAEYQYFEDTNIIDVALASIIATRLSLGDPIWLVLIGPSSGGKSQILRPLALTDEKFLHRVDDLTENTFLSGLNAGKGENVSLLLRIGPKGIIVVSDLTVLFSKSPESRGTILSQFRMIYDGEMTKYSGNQKEPIKWQGYLSVIAGSTPSIYTNFEQVSDMGERFIYYRMKDYNPEKAARLSMKRKVYGKKLDEILSGLYAEYIEKTVKWAANGRWEVDLSEQVKERILKISIFAERVRTMAHVSFREQLIDKIPTPAMPMRTALQLTALAKALLIMRQSEGQTDLNENDLCILDWCGYSLANEEKRACLRVLAEAEFNISVKTQTVADEIGLNTSIVGNILQNLASTGVLKRSGSNDGLLWRIQNKADWDIIRRVESIKVSRDFDLPRSLSSEEISEINLAADQAFSTL